MALNDMRVKNAKPKEKPYKLFDGDGMYLLVVPKGGKCWRLKYRFSGKEKVLALGTYPEITLSEARERRLDQRRLLAQGVDPSAERKRIKAEKTEKSANTFEVVTREWWTLFKHTWSENHACHIIRRLQNDIFPIIGKRPLAEIEAPEIFGVFQEVGKRSLETAHRLKFACNQMFKWAVATGKVKRNPVAELTGALPPVKNRHFAAPTDPKDVGPLLRAIDGFQGSFVVQSALKLGTLTFVRPGELRHAEWSEIDLDAAKWDIPAHRMKMKIPHLVPLSVQAVEVLRQLHEITGSSKYVFPCHRSPLRCMSENAVNAALRRMGFQKSEVTGHGFRAMARTILDEVLQVRPDFIEHQLAHAVKDPLGRAYNRTSHLAERVKMMQKWADYLDELKAGLTPTTF